MELAHLPNDVLLMAQSCLKLMLPIGSSWPSPFLKRQCRWHGIGPAPLKRGIANSMELAQHLPDDVLLMPHSLSKMVPPIALSYPRPSLKRGCQCHEIGPAPLETGMANSVEFALLHDNEAPEISPLSLQEALPISSSWPSPSLKRQCQWHGIDPASLETGMANSMELA